MDSSYQEMAGSLATSQTPGKNALQLSLKFISPDHKEVQRFLLWDHKEPQEEDGSGGDLTSRTGLLLYQGCDFFFFITDEPG